MGVDIRLGSDDPRRFTADATQERRMERLFSGAARTDRSLAQSAAALGRSITQIQDVLDATPNSTHGQNDRTLTLVGTRMVRGMRQQATDIPPEGDPTPRETFTEWETEVTFSAAFSAAPLVFVQVECMGAAPPGVTLKDVTKTSFKVKLTSGGDVHMRFYFQAWGNE